MRIKVTAEDIKAGIRRDGMACPVALAIKRATGESDVLVGLEDANIGGYVFPLPTKARNFIPRFDDLCEVKPIEFVMKDVTGK